jgi:hypothetical protein
VANSEDVSVNDEVNATMDTNTTLASTVDVPEDENQITTSTDNKSEEKNAVSDNNKIGLPRGEEKFTPPAIKNPIAKEETETDKTITEEKTVSNPNIQNQEETLSATEIAEPSEKSYVEIQIPNQLIEGIFTRNISSDKVEKGDIFYISSNMAIFSDGVEVIEKGARIKAIVSRAKSSKSSIRATLGVIFESVESVSGEWVDLQYPELSDVKRGEVIFEKGLKISKLRIKDSTIKVLQ